MLTAKNKKFYLNGKEFQIRSGAMHYFRILPEYWEDLLTKIKMCGLNCVETYTCWNLHEPKKGEFNFSGMLDLEKFIETAEKVGLKVLLRTGPYICGEWENGGFPSWLLKDQNIRLRCNTEPYISHLKDWFSVLLPKIRPHLDTNGGPVIALAVENEYGSFGDDFEYLRTIEDIYKKEGIDCMFIAADGNLEHCLCTGKSHTGIKHGVDFGGGDGTKNSFKDVDIYDSDAPYFAAEYWAGNFTCWNDEECHKDPNTDIKKCITDMMEQGASFNIYMIFGGTNFGFTSGANTTSKKGRFNAFTTSYDYDAAITEWRGYSRRYFDIKESIEAKCGKTEGTLPASPTLQTIGTVELTESAALFDNLHIGKFYRSKTLECMEYFDQTNGYILYKKTMSYDSPHNRIEIKGLHDRAHLFINREYVATRMRLDDESVIKLNKSLKKGDVIEILVENMGRINFGPETFLGDRKGIVESVLLYSDAPYDEIEGFGKHAFDWEVTCLEMDDLSGISFKNGIINQTPAFYKGTFKTESKDGCFIHHDNFRKGLIYINGFNLGRYWENGPQTALYVPGAILKDKNEIIIFETDGLKGAPSVTINDKHGLGDHNEEVFI